MIDVKEFVDVLTKMVYSECKKWGLYPDEDLVQDVLMWGWDALKRLYSQSKGVKWTTYLWSVVDTSLKNRLFVKKRQGSIVSLEDMRDDGDGGVRDWYLEDGRVESFSSRLLKLIVEYGSVVGDDFLKVVMGDIDISNALRSAAVSKSRGEEWIEWWLGRKLNEEEVKCCQEIRELLREV
jgi:hypothetical protein